MMLWMQVCRENCQSSAASWVWLPGCCAVVLMDVFGEPRPLVARGPEHWFSALLYESKLESWLERRVLPSESSPK